MERHANPNFTHWRLHSATGGSQHSIHYRLPCPVMPASALNRYTQISHTVIARHMAHKTRLTSLCLTPCILPLFWMHSDQGADADEFGAYTHLYMPKLKHAAETMQGQMQACALECMGTSAVPSLSSLNCNKHRRKRAVWATTFISGKAPHNAAGVNFKGESLTLADD
eukprot:6191680-Pleurochrysis_carterae.AAC.1